MPKTLYLILSNVDNFVDYVIVPQCHTAELPQMPKTLNVIILNVDHSVDSVILPQ